RGHPRGLERRPSEANPYPACSSLIRADSARVWRQIPVPALFFSTRAPYIGGAGSPAMEINCRRNKPFGPGGSTRRLHPSPAPDRGALAGAKQDRRGRKGRVFSRDVSAVIGLCNSCKRQLCSGCSGCVTQFEKPSLKSWWVKLR